jgi:ABC-type uncharacterized transport system substrate-binding protein
VLWNPDAPVLRVTEVEAAATRLGLTVHRMPVRSVDDLAGAFSTLPRSSREGVIVLTDPLTLRHRVRIVQLVAQRRLPAVYGFGEFARAGGLAAYGPSVTDLARRAAGYVDRVLKGAKPGDLPIEQPTKFELVINVKTAKTLNLTIPPALLLRADQVLE